MVGRTLLADTWVDCGGLTATQGVVYYTCLKHRLDIESMCRAQLSLAAAGLEIVCVSRNEPVAFGRNIVVEGAYGIYTMHRQILAGLEHSQADVVFLCENDVLYHPSHFAYTPPLDRFVYNVNVWKVRYSDGLAVWTDELQQLSGVCASRELLLEFYRARVAQIATGEFNRHFEPGLRQTVGSRNVENRMSGYPNICIRHDQNLTPSKWSPSEFRNPRYAQGWRESDYVPGWGYTRDLFAQKEEA